MKENIIKIKSFNSIKIKNWKKLKTPQTPAQKDELGRFANKYILSNRNRNIIVWIRQDTPKDLKEIIIGGYANRGFELVYTNDIKINSKVIALEFSNKAKEARETGSRYKLTYKGFNKFKFKNKKK